LKNSKIDNLILLVYSISPFWLQFFFFLHLTHAISGEVGKWGSGDKIIDAGDFT